MGIIIILVLVGLYLIFDGYQTLQDGDIPQGLMVTIIGSILECSLFFI